MSKTILLMVFLIIQTTGLFAQGQAEDVYQLQQSDVSCYVQNGSTKHMTSYPSLLPLSHYVAGVKRDFFQWSLPEEIIPDGSTINSVRILITNIDSPDNHELVASFFNVSQDLNNASASDLWDATDDFSQSIGQRQSNNFTIDYTYPEGSPFAQAVQNALIDDYFTLGIRDANELTQNYGYRLNNSYVQLEIHFTRPAVNATITQVLADNSTVVGSVNRWDGNKFKDVGNLPAHPTFYVGTNEILQATQSLQSDNPKQKYNNWNELSDVTNHHVFSITPNTDYFIAHLDETFETVTIKATLTNGTNGNNIWFKDPWLIDYSDPDYGNTPRNRGMDDDGPDKLEFKQRPSPFYPYYTTGYNGDVYQGVFLDQNPDPNDPNKPYYYVKADAQQTFSAHGQTITGYFHHWGGSGVEYQNVNNRETPVVFHTQDAQAIARYKGHLASNVARATGYNNGRRVVKNDSMLYMVYQDDGTIWFTKSKDNGQTWSKESRLSPRKYTENGVEHSFINPSIALYGDYFYVVWEEQIINGSQRQHKIYFKKYHINFGWSQSQILSTSGWYSNTNSERPSVSAGSDPNILVAWKDKGTGKIKVKVYDDGDWSETYTLSSAYGYPEAIILKNADHPIVLIWAQSNKIKYISGRYMEEEFDWQGIVDLTSGLPSWYDQHKRPSACADNRGIGYVAWEAYDGAMLENVILYQCYDFKNNGQLFGSLTVVASEEGSASQSHLLNTSISYDEESHKTTIFYQYNNSIYRKQKSGTSWSSANYGSGKYPSVACNSDLGAVWTRYTSAPYLLKTENSNGYVTKVGASPVAVKKRFYYKGDKITIAELSDLTMNGRQFLLDDTLYSDELSFSGSDDFSYLLSYVTPNALSEQPGILFKAGDRVMHTETLSWSEANTTNRSAFTYVQDKSTEQKIKLAFTGPTPFVVTVLGKEESLAKSAKEPLSQKQPLPERYELSANYPNPFNPSTRIRVSLPQASLVDLSVFDVNGRKVKQLLTGNKPAGIYEVVFDGSNLASGVYIYRLQANDFTAVKRMFLVK